MDFHDAVRQALDKFDTIFDVLVLDVALGVDHFGGIDFHNKLVDGGYRRRWRNVFIWTMHTYSDIANAVYKQSGSNNEQYILRVFCETAGIPYLNVWRTGFGGNDALVLRLREIVDTAPDRHCRHCGRANGGDGGEDIYSFQ